MVANGKTKLPKVDDERLQANLAEVLASALDERAMLSAVTRLLVPRVGDICLADIIEDDGFVVRVDTTLEAWRLAPTPALRAGETVLIPDLTQSALAPIAPDPAAATAARPQPCRQVRQKY